MVEKPRVPLLGISIKAAEEKNGKVKRRKLRSIQTDAHNSNIA